MPYKNKDDDNDSALRRGLERSAKVRDIGPPPECENKRLRKKVESCPEEFLRVLWPELFRWQFSPDQRKGIFQLDEITERGGLQAIADPRGTGKTQRVIRQALKAILTGKRRYVCIVSATEKAAKKIIKSIRTIVCYSAKLQGLFPAELHGFKQLKGQNRLAGGQLCVGMPTEIGVAADQIVFPMIPGSKCAGAIISSCSITGNVRGQFHTLSDGAVIRPDLVIVDDPQTKESAKSRTQTEDRLEIIEGDVLGLAGPDTPIACVVLCTVIKTDDMSDRILKEVKWHGRRTKVIVEWPTNTKAWEEYFDHFDEAISQGKPQRINALYRKRRKELDAGCVVGWKSRIETGDVSAIQTAMHIWHRMGATAFAAECQNEPVRPDAASSLITSTELLTRINSLPRGEVPLKAEHITAAIDVQGELLYWTICWWMRGFGGGILDYGAFPDQGRNYFALSEANPTLQHATKRTAKMAAVRAGLDTLISRLMSRVFVRPDKLPMRVERLCVDANWGESTDHVYDACRESPFAQLLRPTHGKGFSVRERPMSQWKAQAGETAGFHWFKRVGKRAIRYLVKDSNFWKTFVHNGLLLQPEEPHSISLFHAMPHEHRLLADHLTSEVRHRPKTEDGRTVDQFVLIPGRENHWLDTLVDCAVGASELGVTLRETPIPTQPARKGPIEPTYY
ncbi:MAG: phage terminase large subunit family protein [Planctomycetes bacterium]|nr:phage terminase large subunit family protein [Planctomycetota bacterium]